MRGKAYTDTASEYWSNLSAIPYEYLYETSVGIRRGMWSVSWFKELLGEAAEEKAKSMGTSVEELLEREARLISPGSEGLITVANSWRPIICHTERQCSSALMDDIRGPICIALF